MWESLLAGALALAFDPVGSFPSTFTHNAYIEKISCDTGSGTGFKLNTGVWVSVHHVTSMTGCKVDGKPIVVTHSDPEHDFSTFAVPGDYRRGGIKADCAGFRDRQWYYGQGHARGLAVVTSVPVMYSVLLNLLGHERGWQILAYNRFIPGQSGGPTLNQWGEATGTNNAYGIFHNISASRALKDTVVCRG